MKKNILILGAIVTGAIITGAIFMAFKFMESEETKTCRSTETLSASTQPVFNFLPYNTFPPEDLVYKIESRFMTTVSKSDLRKAKTIIDILPAKATHGVDNYNYARVSILDDFRETDQRELGKNEYLTEGQINLLESTRDSEDIYIRSDYDYKNDYDGNKAHSYLTYFISVVPDKQAIYQDGHEELIKYLKESSKEEVKVITKEGLKAGQVRFTITKEGIIDKVQLSSSSGYESVDTKLIHMINNMPAQWTPASNSQGENVDQDLVFFFGLQGC